MDGKILIGNWKMYGSKSLLADFAKLNLSGIAGSNSCSLAVPFTLIEQARQQLSKLGWEIGAQDVSEHQEGAWTGCISATMLSATACTFALVGHSERRANQHETDQQIAAKIIRLSEQSITSVACIGETLAERENGQMENRISSQIESLISPLQSAQNAILAYEPIWAIGTGKSATPEQAAEVHHLIRQQLNKNGLEKVKLLYGGSVNGDNIRTLLSQPNIDGALIGGASLKVDGWQTMLGSLA